ncbi:hydrogenase 3 maturation endopeptidase HyCI [Planctomycetota bacterium]
MDRETLSKVLLALPIDKTLILGIGHRLKGDDGVGPFICDLIEDRINAEVLDVGSTPENYIGPIVALKPSAILMLDAADIGQEPGSYTLLPREGLATTLASTHALSWQLLWDTLGQYMPMSVYFLGIQPASTALGESLTKPVEQTAYIIAEELMSIFAKSA